MICPEEVASDDTPYGSRSVHYETRSISPERIRDYRWTILRSSRIVPIEAIAELAAYAFLLVVGTNGSEVFRKATAEGEEINLFLIYENSSQNLVA